MSMPHPYYILGADNKKLGVMYTTYFSWSPLSRQRNKERFDAELGGLIVTDLARYCAGQQKSAPAPAFKLDDVKSIKSQSGDVVPANEFANCVHAYIKLLQSTLKLAKAQDKEPDAQQRIEEAEGVRLLLSRPANASNSPAKTAPHA